MLLGLMLGMTGLVIDDGDPGSWPRRPIVLPKAGPRSRSNGCGCAASRCGSPGVQARQAWGADRAEQQPQEELNAIKAGKQYGWPYVYGVEEVANPQDEPPGGIPAATWARMSEAAVLGYSAHAAPMQMAFYPGGPFPNAYDGDAFVAFRSSWAREAPSGYEVARIRFANGQTRSIEPFLTSFLVDGGQAETARLAGIAVAKDGALLVGDDENGILYRVSYGDGRGQATPLNPAGDGHA
jgi:glucose/arabinose dehydrogenase